MATPLRNALVGLALAGSLAACSLERGSGTPTSGPTHGSAATPAATPAVATGVPESASPPTSTGAPELGTWARLAIGDRQPAAREDHTWTVADDGVTAFLFGGRDGQTVFADLWAFDLRSDGWRRVRQEGAGPAARFGHEAAWLPGRGLLVWAGQAGEDFFDDAWLFDPVAEAWRRLDAGGDVPLARYGSCSGIGPDGRFWISHGFTANGVRFDDTRTLDLDDLRWRDRTPEGAAPIERCLHACWWTGDGRLALYGGQTNGVPALGDLWFLTPGPGGAGGSSWTEAEGQAAPPRQLPAVASGDGVTVAVGGRGADGEALGDTWVLLDGAALLTAVRTSDGPPARSGAALVHDAARDRFVLFGGVDQDPFDDAWALTLR